MAYADRNASNSRVVAIIIVAIVHALLGWAFIVGLIPNVAKKLAQDLKTFEVQEEAPPPEEEPPPPPPQEKVQPPPVTVTPPIVQTQATPQLVLPPQPPPPPQQTITPPAPPPPPNVPPPPKLAQPATPRGNPSTWVTTDDYPPRALREERTGTTAVAWDITTDGRIENCRVTSSSGSPDLDDAACKNITRRGRYKPALDDAGNPIKTSSSRRVVWRIPEN